jgi:hypothetical protein
LGVVHNSMARRADSVAAAAVLSPGNAARPASLLDACLHPAWAAFGVPCFVDCVPAALPVLSQYLGAFHTPLFPIHTHSCTQLLSPPECLHTPHSLPVQVAFPGQQRGDPSSPTALSVEPPPVVLRAAVQLRLQMRAEHPALDRAQPAAACVRVQAHDVSVQQPVVHSSMGCVMMGLGVLVVHSRLQHQAVHPCCPPLQHQAVHPCSTIYMHFT